MTLGGRTVTWQPRVIDGGKSKAAAPEAVAAEFRNQLNQLVYTFRDEHRTVDDFDLVCQLAQVLTEGVIATERFNAEVFGAVMQKLFVHVAQKNGQGWSKK